jgi:mRNA interferase RelE/StbE
VYAVEYSGEARRVLKAMPRNMSKLVESKVEALARDPFRATNVKKLVGVPGYRLRVGDWRVIYDVDSGRVVVRVLRIGGRGGVYR